MGLGVLALVCLRESLGCLLFAVDGGDASLALDATLHGAKPPTHAGNHRPSDDETDDHPTHLGGPTRTTRSTWTVLDGT